MGLYCLLSGGGVRLRVGHLGPMEGKAGLLVPGEGRVVWYGASEGGQGQ